MGMMQAELFLRDGAVALPRGSAPSGRGAAVARSRSQRGLMAHHAGLAAEDRVAARYESAGLPVCARRWRGRYGEIDIIARNGEQVVFVEVKQSGTHMQAAEHFDRRQYERIWLAGSEFLEGEPKGQFTDVRFDLVLVDGQGRMEVMENPWID